MEDLEDGESDQSEVENLRCVHCQSLLSKHDDVICYNYKEMVRLRLTYENLTSAVRRTTIVVRNFLKVIKNLEPNK